MILKPTADLLEQLHNEVVRWLSEPSGRKIDILQSSNNDPIAPSGALEGEDSVPALQPISDSVQNDHSTVNHTSEEGVTASIGEQESRGSRIRETSKKLYDSLTTHQPSLDEGLVGLLAEDLSQEKQYHRLVPNLAVDLLRLLLLSIDKESHTAKVHVERLSLALRLYVADTGATFDIPGTVPGVQTAIELCLSIPVRETASGAAALMDMGNVCLALYMSTKQKDWLDRAIEVRRRTVTLQDRLSVDDTAQKPRIEDRCETCRSLAHMQLLCLPNDSDRALDEAAAHCKLALDLALDLAPNDDEAQELRRKIFETLYISLRQRKHSGFAERFELISASLGVLQSTPDPSPELRERLIRVLVELSIFYSFRYVEMPEFDPVTGKRLKEIPDEKACFENDVFKIVQDQISQEVAAVRQGRRGAQEVQANFAESSDAYYTAYQEKSAFFALGAAIELGNVAVLLSRPGEKARNDALLSQAEKLMEHVHCTSNPGFVNPAIHYMETSIADMSDDSPVDYVNAFRRYGRLLLSAYEQTYAAGLLDDAIETVRKHTDPTKPDKGNAAIGAVDNISWLHAMQTLARCHEARFLRNAKPEDSETASWIAGIACDVAQEEHLFAAERPSEVGVSLLWTYGKIMLTRYRQLGTASLLKGSIMNLESCMKLTSIQCMEWPDRSETLSDAYRELMKLENVDVNRTHAMLRLELPYIELKAEGSEYGDVSDALGMHTLVARSLQAPARFTSGDSLRNSPILLQTLRMKFACYARIAIKLADLLEESSQTVRARLIETATQEEQGGKSSGKQLPADSAVKASMQTLIDRVYGKQFKPFKWDKPSPTNELEMAELWSRNALKYYREVAESPECSALDRTNAAFCASKLLVAEGNELDAWLLIDRAVKLLGAVEFIALTLKDQEYLLQRLSGLPGWAATLALRAGKPASEVMGLLEMTRARITGVALDLRRDLSLLAETDSHAAAEYEKIAKSLLSRGASGTTRVVVFERNGAFMAQRLSPAAGDLKRAAHLKVIAQQLHDTVDKKSDAGIKATTHAALDLKGDADIKSTTHDAVDKRRAADIKDSADQLHDALQKQLVVSPSATLPETTTDGPLVSFVTTDLGSHAIMVTSAGIESMPLPKLLKSDIDANLQLLIGPNALYKGLASTEYDRNARLSVLLEWLWCCAVGPVLESLGMIRPIDAGEMPLPRIWWVDGGALSAFPLHAAGKYGVGAASTDNAMSQVVSSYASSLRMLDYLRTLANRTSRLGRAEQREVVIVSMSTTHGMAPLPFAAQEANAVQECLRRAGWCSSSSSAVNTATVLEQPSKEDLVDRLLGGATAGMLHLICHGQTDQVSPSESYLVLDNTAHDAAERLSIEEIGSVKTSGAQLAYLSACSSAEHGNLGLIDEVIHLANGFQMIGVPRVVATLWPVDDEASATIAAQFYETLTRTRTLTGVWEDATTRWNTAEALHTAVKSYMETDDGISSNAESFLSWVPLVHYGI
jgi:hypothetical protein